MGTFKFSMRMLVKDYKKSLFYGITLIFAVAVCFVFFNIINNPEIPVTYTVVTDAPREIIKRLFRKSIDDYNKIKCITVIEKKTAFIGKYFALFRK